MLAFTLHLTFLDNKRILKLCFSLCFSLYFVLKFGLLQADLNECIECYGNELCPFFQNQEIQLTWFSVFLYIINPNLTKSVFYGIFNSTGIVIKRIVRRTENNSAGMIAVKDNLILCASVSDVGFLFTGIQNSKEPWFDWSSSTEPLLLMVITFGFFFTFVCRYIFANANSVFLYFQTQGNWPFPKYYGACGEFFVEEYKGEPLANFLFSDFQKRIFLATSLLEMAELFTFGHPSLAFYFTDYSLDNLVVDSRGNVSLIDLDNVIISNKSAIQRNKSMKISIHTSEILDDYKYAFSPSDVCLHYLSDHNYFSICKYLLFHPKDGLLNNIPPEIEKWEEVLWLLSECSHPKVMSDRFSAGQELKTLLKEISNKFVWSQ